MYEICREKPKKKAVLKTYKVKQIYVLYIKNKDLHSKGKKVMLSSVKLSFNCEKAEFTESIIKKRKHFLIFVAL